MRPRERRAPGTAFRLRSGHGPARGSRPGGLGVAALAAAALVGLLLAAAPAAAQPAGPLEVRLLTGSGGWGAPARAEIHLSAPAHLAVFEIRPGVGALMLWPPDRRRVGRLPAGRHALPLDAGRFGFPDRRRLPLPGHPAPGRLRHLFQPYLLAVASREPLWLSRHFHGSLFQPRQVFPSVGTMVNAVLSDVLPHARRVGWSFDLVPAFPSRFGPHDRYDPYSPHAPRDPYGPYDRWWPYDPLDPWGGMPW